MEMKEIVYNKSCNACGSEKLEACIEFPDPNNVSITDAWKPNTTITFRCAECGELVEKIEIYAGENKPCKVQVTANQDVQDIFDDTDMDNIKAELAEAKAEVKIVRDQYGQLEADMHAQYIKANTYKSLLMDIYKLSNKGGAKNA